MRRFAPLALAALVALPAGCGTSGDDFEPGDAVGLTTQSAGAYTTKRLSGPPRTSVYDATGHWVATFTDGARTVRLYGPSRTFQEGTYPAVATTSWVRVLPAPFAGTVDPAWLASALADRSPDMLAVAFAYSTGQAADAHYREGSDWNDYLGTSFRYATGTLATPSGATGGFDCSGFVRFVYGYRGGVPLALSPTIDHQALPRTAAQIFGAGPGVVTIPNGGTPADPTDLVAGDLVFFDATADAQRTIDHTGIYLGLDEHGDHRFISSRRSPDGPTMGDSGGRSTLDGTGTFATAFRGARRL